MIPKRVDLRGSPREIGREHGRQLSEEIKRQIKIYEDMFERTSKLNWADVREVATAYAATIRRLAPDIYTEMIGIAEGAGLDALDIVALNSRSEIALGMFSDGCTSLGWKRNDGGILLAQNWDWNPAVTENMAIMTVKQGGKPDIYMINEAGLVGKIGFNSSSVGLCFNAIRAKPTDTNKLPIHVILRLCLESRTKAEAISYLELLGSSASAQHILIADSTGPTGLELSPVGNTFIDPDRNGIVLHTNHFLANRYADEPPWLQGSPVRLDRAKELTKELAAENSHVGARELREKIFSDQVNAPESICWQRDTRKPLSSAVETLFNIIIALGDKDSPSAEVVFGRPGSDDQSGVVRLP